MIPQFENRGGLIGQLRDHALRGSDEGAWAEAIEQTFVSTRRVSLRNEPGDFVQVELEARKLLIGGNALRSFYTLKASHIEEGLTYDFLPPHVVEVLRKNKVSAGENENATETIHVSAGDESDEAEDENYDYDDVDFRHTRGLEYYLDGKGSVLRNSRIDLYEDNEGTVDIVGDRVGQYGPLKNPESAVLTLRDWNLYSSQNATPDADLLDSGDGIDELRYDVSFYDIVQRYSADKTLIRHSQADNKRSMLVMLAFLRSEASAKDIQELL
jgi:hypothetical protein